MGFDLSIIVPTYNRAESLRRCLAAIQKNTACDFQVIVVDGGGNDSTPAVLDEHRSWLHDRLTVVREEKREGFVRAANKGFAVATGRCMTWINDDARPLAGAFDEALSQVDHSDDKLGFVALFHRWHSLRNIAYETIFQGRHYRLCHVRGTLYANFAVGRRDTFQRLNYFDDRFFLNGADPDLSLKAWHAGLRIEPAYGAMIDHDELTDHRRTEDRTRAEADNVKLFAKWKLPERNPHRNDFDPRRPCTLLGLNEEPGC